jgi:hypothetical protein
LQTLPPNDGNVFASPLASDHDWSGVDMKISFTDELRELERLQKAGVVNDEECFKIQMLLIYRNFVRSSKREAADFLNMSVSDLLDLTRNGEGVSEP